MPTSAGAACSRGSAPRSSSSCRQRAPGSGGARAPAGLAASVALVALAGAARRLGRTRGEAGAIALVAWTAFGVAQLVPGYLDVYPFALAVTALYLWTALGVLAGDVHPGWPLVIAFLAP